MLILAAAAIVEIGTGLALIVSPALVATLLLDAQLDATATVLARCFGIALLALGLACGPKQATVAPRSPAVIGMLTYNAGIALYLGYVGAAAHIGGPLLWPAVVLHAAMTLALARVGLARNSRG